MPSECSIISISPELLSRTFELAALSLDVRLGCHEVSHYMLVCRAWRDAGEPVLYENLEFVNVTTFRMFVATFRKLLSAERFIGNYIRRLVLKSGQWDTIGSSDTSALVAVLMKASNLRHAHVEEPFATTALTVMSDTCRSGLQYLHLELPASSVPMIPTYAAPFLHLEHLILSIYHEETRSSEISEAAPWTMNRLQSLGILSSTSPPPLALIRFLANCSFPIIQSLEIDVDVTSKHEARVISELISMFTLLRVNLTLVRKYHQYALPHIRAATLCISDTPQSVNSLSHHIKKLHIESPTKYKEAFAFFRELCSTDTAVQEVFLDNWDVCANWFDSDEDADLVIEDAPHMMQLFHWAAVLWRRKGIRVYDSDAKLISDYFTDQAKDVALS